MVHRLFLLAILLYAITTSAQDADVVVIDEHTMVTVEGNGMMEYEQSRSYKLLNAKAQWVGKWNIGLDKNTKLAEFNGVLSDVNGRVLRKIKKSDLKSTQLSEGMSDGITTLYLDLTPASYPCMLTLTVRVKKTDGILSYPVFCPITRSRVAVQHASYSLAMPPSMKCRWHVENMENEVKESMDDKGRKTYSLECGQVDALADEPFSPDFIDVVPVAFFAPCDFSYGEWKGKMDSWEDFGRWHANLLAGRQVLPDNLKNQLHLLVDTCASDWSRVDVLYRWLQRNTRYVSIQLGVGGYQPFKAEDVYKNGFGDCKGLSNLMVAMLKEVGIAAHYVIIGTDNKKLFHDYPNANQFNHAIAMAVLPNDTLWLECTNQHLPTGYLHGGIAGHEALAITQQGGMLVEIPDYNEHDNLVENSMKIRLHEDGKADVDWSMGAAGAKYGDFFALTLMDGSQRRNVVRDLMGLGQASLDGITVESHRGDSHHLEMKVSCSAHASNVASATGQRLFFSLKPMASFPMDLPEGKRKMDLVVEEGCTFDYELDVDMPEGYEVEAAPTPMKVDSPYGSSSFELSTVDGHVRIRHILILHQGTYPAENNAEFRAFLRSAMLGYAQRMVLKKAN